MDDDKVTENDVQIHFDKTKQTLFFRVPKVSELETAIAPVREVVKAKDIKNVKSSVKTK